METLSINARLSTQRKTLHGRDYLVAPLTLIVPGVLNGSQGPLYYPPEEITKNVLAWNNIPIVVYHPTLDGKQVSARRPDVLEKAAVGNVFNARVEDDKLKADGWFSLDNVMRVDNRIFKKLQAEEAIELSTGLFTDNIPAEPDATFNGISYTHVARNYRPDHLAILPDQTGACSIKDGCGVLVNKGEIPSNNNDSTKEGSKMPLTEKQKKEIVGALIANSCCWDAEDLEILNAFSDDKLVALKGQADKESQQETVINSATTEYTDELGTVHTWNAEKQVWENKAKDPKPVENEEKKMTPEDWWNQAPEEVKATVNFGRELEKKERTRLIEKLTANVKEEDKEKLQRQFEATTTENLQGLLSLVPESEPTPVTNYFGAAGPRPTPTINEDKFAPFGLPADYIQNEEKK